MRTSQSSDFATNAVVKVPWRLLSYFGLFLRHYKVTTRFHILLLTILKRASPVLKAQIEMTWAV
jgi:hypothetical protein